MGKPGQDYFGQCGDIQRNNLDALADALPMFSGWTQHLMLQGTDKLKLGIYITYSGSKNAEIVRNIVVCNHSSIGQLHFTLSNG